MGGKLTICPDELDEEDELEEEEDELDEDELEELLLVLAPLGVSSAPHPAKANAIVSSKKPVNLLVTSTFIIAFTPREQPWQLLLP